MHRRRFLAATAAALPATSAGCLAGGGPGTSTDREPTDRVTDPTATTPEPTSTSETEGPGYSIDVEDVAVSRRTTTIQSGAHVDVAADPEEQYVVADVAVAPHVDGETTVDPPAPADLRFVATLDGDEYRRAFATEFGGGRRTRMAVPVPTGIDPDEGALAVGPGGGGGVSHQFTPEQLDRIARVPRFSLDSFALEAGNATVRATLAVSNEGDRDGRFLAELGTDYISDTPEVAFAVPAGETVTREESVPIHAEDADEVTVVLGWGSTYHRKTVEL
ncbi:hypothetical protein [Haloarchaeobius amylolyticus]|uniref:hypothetical protein n=1 Tax=Haloarchaeobius amylolyticus TaxID=1198296 RepID=UPI00227121E8|nr:hypothetical protein [Haloarchaeobius amylolyticus]